MGSSENPIRLLNFILLNLYQQPLLNRTFPTLISDLFWDALTRYPQEHLILYPFIESDVPAFPTWGIKVGLLNTLANDFTQAVHFGLQSSLYAKASQIDRPLSRSHFKSSLAVYFRAFILSVTVQHVGYIYLAETDKLPRRDFHPLGQIFCWLQPHRTVLEVFPLTRLFSNVNPI